MRPGNNLALLACLDTIILTKAFIIDGDSGRGRGKPDDGGCYRLRRGSCGFS